MILKPQVHRLWLRPPASPDDSSLFNGGILGRAELGGSRSSGPRALRSSWSGISRGRFGLAHALASCLPRPNNGW
jgi:hypothetical protein